MVMAVLGTLLAISVLYMIWLCMGIFMGLLGFSRDQEGKVKFSLATMLGYVVVIGGALELWFWASEKWGGALVLGVIFGLVFMLVIPLEILFKSVR